MSEMGQKRRFCNVRATSALPLKADIHRKGRHVSNVPIPDINTFRRRQTRAFSRFHADYGPVFPLRFVVEFLTTDRALPRLLGPLWVMSRLAASGRPGSIGLAAR